MTGHRVMLPDRLVKTAYRLRFDTKGIKPHGATAAVDPCEISCEQRHRRGRCGQVWPIFLVALGVRLIECSGV
jgi:hypothetical protein